VIVCLLGVIGAFLTSYARARAEPLGIDAKVGLIQRAERLVLLCAPQAIFGLTLNGRVLMGIVILLSLTSWVTVVQRMMYVYRATTPPTSTSTSSEPNVAKDATPFTGDRVVR
jgi:CDP-diacylglycerol--glycerol-3-phosphate 3-phosphatidyltransferase